MLERGHSDLAEISIDDKERLKLIHAGTDALRSIRLYLGGSMVLGACLSFLGYLWVVEWHAKVKPGAPYSLLSYGLEFATAACCVGWKILLSLAPLVDSIYFAKLIVVVEAVVTFFLHFAHDVDCIFQGGCAYTSQSFFSAVGDLSTAVVFLTGALTVLCGRSAVQIQTRLWCSLSTMLVLRLIRRLVLIIWTAISLHKLSLAFCWAVPEAIGLYVVSTPHLRESVRGFFRRIVQAHGSKAAAAGVAGLIGNSSAEEALTQARQRFRCIRVDRLVYEDFQQSQVVAVPLCQRTEACCLGECDAFISHSWHDDVEAKWATLQEWRGCFLAHHKREPRVWFDKACIDQNRIEDDLRCLPLFLSGCKQLLVLCGPTYLTRLWCIVELFTFVHAGGDQTHTDIRQVLQGGYEQEDKDAIAAAVESFDAAQCKCSLDSDKDKMIRVILLAFDDMGSFNKQVRKLMSRMGIDSQINSNSSSCDSDSSMYSHD